MTVSSITGPATAIANSQAQVTWTVTNIGSGTAYGPWHDAVYLVRNPDTDPVETFAGQLLEGNGVVLGPGASLHHDRHHPCSRNGSEQSALGGKDQRSGRDIEGQNTTNNTGQSLDVVSVDLPELVPGAAPTNSSFASTGQSAWFKVTPGASNNVSINAALASQLGTNPCSVQPFIARGYVPDPQHYDIQQIEFNSPTASAVISNTSDQIYYVTAYAQSLPVSPDGFTISASLVRFGLTSVSPASAVNVGMATLTFTGGGSHGPVGLPTGRCKQQYL